MVPLVGAFFLFFSPFPVAGSQVLLDREGATHVFDGIGAISGGGATSRLLLEYPEPQRSEILDFLFLPEFGASLHILKVEIGGDSQSTDGVESSHMHSEDDMDFTRGYEWWLMKEAKKRNPNIKLYGLPWAFPGWVTNNISWPYVFPEKLANYTVNWIQGAKDVHGLDMDYLGIWNERECDPTYVKILRKTLDKRGFENVLIVANDGDGTVCYDMAKDEELFDAVKRVGLHYPPDDVDWSPCTDLGTPVWSSEESSSFDDINGAGCWIRVINAHYVNHNATSSIMWNLVGSYMHGTSWYASSMMTAVEPWSGHYEVAPVVWATAHLTQFAQPGWVYLKTGTGSGQFEKGGYFVSLWDPETGNFTFTGAKIDEDHARCTRPDLPVKPWGQDIVPIQSEEITFELAENMGNLPIHLAVFRSSLDPFAEEPAMFERKRDIILSNTRKFTLSIGLGEIVTVSTVRKASKGIHPNPPASSPQFPLDFLSDFEGLALGQEGLRFTDQIGVFEIQEENSLHNISFSRSKNHVNHVMRQMVPQSPVIWDGGDVRGPVSLIGMFEWQDINITARFKLPMSINKDGSSNDSATRAVKNAACLGVRIDQMWTQGIVFCYAEDGQWALAQGGPWQTDGSFHPESVYTTGYGPAVGSESWFNLSLSVSVDDAATATLNGEPIVSDFKTNSKGFGFAGVGCNGWFALEFDDIMITPADRRQWKSEFMPQTCRVAAKGGDKVDVGKCSRNGSPSEGLSWELLSSFQLRHVSSGLCAQAVEAKDQSMIELQKCASAGDAELRLQQFWNDYTNIRNMLLPLTLGTNKEASDLQLAALSDHSVVLALDTADDIAWSTWGYFPNTMQLRNKYPWENSLASGSDDSMCLRACT